MFVIRSDGFVETLFSYKCKQYVPSRCMLYKTDSVQGT